MKTIHFLDLTELSVGIILHGVNCQGVMGAGIAYALKNKYPRIETNYRFLCQHAPNPYTLLGEIDVVEMSPHLFIVNCFTQNFFGFHSDRPPASYSAIHECLLKVVEFSMYHRDLPIYMPQIGCGLGGLEWDIVNDIVEYVENKYKVLINVCDLPRNKPI